MTARWKVRPKGRVRTKGMNSLERDYSQLLGMRQRAGEVAWFAYEAIKFRLADKTFYTPDFIVMLADGTMEVHETKGFMRDDANVKIKVAAETFPFRFILVKKARREWTYAVIGNDPPT